MIYGDVEGMEVEVVLLIWRRNTDITTITLMDPNLMCMLLAQTQIPDKREFTWPN